jgi:predicted ArsR family transcriptional regulator
MAAAASINDPLRRSLFELVSSSDDAIGRDDAAAALDIPRSTAAFHLDRLERDGLLVAIFRKTSAKTGPGSGRPAKVYSRSSQEFAVSIPERRYDLAAELLASAIDESHRTGEPVRDALERVATAEGRELGRSAGSFVDALAETGYEPRDDGAGGLTLVNCPFHRLAASHTEIICHANVALLSGAVEGAGDSEHAVVFEPSATHCCVHVTPATAAP